MTDARSVGSFIRYNRLNRGKQMYPHDCGRSVLAGMALGATLLLGPMVKAETVPRSSVASPDVYKVMAEGNGLRVVLATWQPGQRDQWHSHPASTYYWLTD